MGQAPAHDMPPRVTRGTRRLVRTLGSLMTILEVVLYAIVFGSALAIGCVEPWGYVPLWWSAALIGLLTAIQQLLVVVLRQRLGRRVLVRDGATINHGSHTE